MDTATQTLLFLSVGIVPVHKEGLLDEALHRPMQPVVLVRIIGNERPAVDH